MANKYKRILLKLSGEAIAKKNENGAIESIFDENIIFGITSSIKKLVESGTQVAVVIGAGNIWRGAYAKGVKRARADQMGMLGTMINCLRLEDDLEKQGLPATVFSPIAMNSFATQYNFRDAIDKLNSGSVVIFGCGTGIPFVTTDTTVCVRAAEIDADVIMMAKNIDGVYERDPRDKNGNIDPSVKRYKMISLDDCLKKSLHATDLYATMMAQEQKINMYIFALSDPENIYRAANGEEIGTLVTYEQVEPVTY